MAESNTKLHKV